MAYVPKSVQRRLNKDALRRQAGLVQKYEDACDDHVEREMTAGVRQPGKSRAGWPRRLEVGKDSKEFCARWNVFFNGIRQTACKVADMDQGYIERFKRARGHLVSSNETEVLHGNVQIVPR